MSDPMPPVYIEKNSRETLRLSVDDYRGHMLLGARVWFKPSGGGDLRPGKDGWAINVDKLPALIEGLQQIEQEARAAGLIE